MKVSLLTYDELENKCRLTQYIEESEGISILKVPIPHSYQLGEAPKKAGDG